MAESYIKNENHKTHHYVIYQSVQDFPEFFCDCFCQKCSNLLLLFSKIAVFFFFFAKSAKLQLRENVLHSLSQ